MRRNSLDGYRKRSAGLPGTVIVLYLAISAEVLRQFRNVVHPNQYLQHFAHERFSKKLLNRLLNIYDGAIFPQFERNSELKFASTTARTAEGSNKVTR